MPEGCAVRAYVLMTNHVHLLVAPMTEGATGRVMQSPGRRYVRYINDRYRRTGTLWEGRYKACLVENGDHLMQCHRSGPRKIGRLKKSDETQGNRERPR